MIEKQSQKAGVGSIQNQIGNIAVYISNDKEAMKILMELFETRMEKYTLEAEKKAIEHISSLNEKIIYKIGKLEGAFEQFKDPAFQYLLRNAQATASRTDSKDDYEILAELIGQHIEHKDDRIITSTVSEAIKIIDQIDVYSLQVLTVFYTLIDVKFINSSTKKLLYDINSYIEQILPEELPSTQEWINHLDMLKLVRYNSIGKFKSLQNILSASYTENIVTGIKKDSENYEVVRKMFPNDAVFSAFMVDNDLLDSYVKLRITEDSIKNGQAYQIIDKDIIDTLNNLLNDVKTIQSYYDKDAKLLQQVQNNFMVQFNSYPKLKAFNDWLSSLNYSFDLTLLGQLIANMNLKRYIPDCPIFYK
ncbi:MAG: hypothetical protein MSA07_00070 [Mucispirillum sp.]|nr:hypothetical protein [Mucispirillum sp.]